MDAVVLAAGRGSRINDAAAPYMKPLLQLFEGEPLVVRAARQAAYYARHVVVVAAPQNAELVANALEDHNIEALVVIQSRPRGPGHALLQGLAACDPEDHRVLVSIATDISTTDDVAAVAKTGESWHTYTCVGVRLYNRVEAEKFTFYDADNVWREKQPPKSDQLLVQCWVGLFVGELSNMRSKLTTELQRCVEGDRELPIGPYLRDFMYAGRDRLVPVSSTPIKTAADYARVRGVR